MVDISKAVSSISSWKSRGRVAVEINCRRLRFPRLLAARVVRKSKPDPSARPQRQRDYDRERQLRAFPWLTRRTAAGLRFFAGVACFSDHASKFRSLRERSELWPVLENGARRPQMEWYVGMSPIDRRRQEEALSQIRA